MYNVTHKIYNYIDEGLRTFGTVDIPFCNLYIQYILIPKSWEHIILKIMVYRSNP